MHFKTNVFEFRTDSLCKSQLSALYFCHGPHQIWHVNSPPPPKKTVCCWLNLEVRTSVTTRRQLKLFIEFHWCLCKESAWWALGLSFLVFPLCWMYQDPLSLAAQCVCMCVFLWICVCPLAPWFCMKFHHTVYTHTHTHTIPFRHTLCSSSLAEWSRLPCPFQGYRFANKRSNVSMGCVSVVGLFKSSSPSSDRSSSCNRLNHYRPQTEGRSRPLWSAVSGLVGSRVVVRLVDDS